VGERLAFLAMGHPLVALPFFALETSLFHFPEPEIELRRGADFHLAVQFPQQFGSVIKCALPEEISQRDWIGLHALVNGLPYWSFSQRQSQPMDLVNLVYIGAEQEVDRAFTAAGWTGAQVNSMRATVKVMRAIAENRGLSEAPMRMLLLDGATPSMQLQQSLDTFAKRDHLRIWARGEEFNGRQVWASSATRDLAAVFGMHPFGFTHQIQDDVDLERDQVVGDLAFTGCVDSVEYVARPETVRTSGQVYRKGVITDSRVAVVTLNSCEEPRQNLSDIGEMPRPRKLVRWVRRVTLTARNHYLRDNWAWRAGEAVRLSFNTVRSWQQERKDELLASELDAKLAARPELRQDFAAK
jgi:LssY C-terminus